MSTSIEALEATHKQNRSAQARAQAAYRLRPTPEQKRVWDTAKAAAHASRKALDAAKKAGPDRRPSGAEAVNLEPARYELAHQTHRMVQIFRLLGETLRVDIKRNAYDNQSSAVIEIYDPASRAWNRLDFLVQSEMTVLDREKTTRGDLVPVVSYVSALNEAARTRFQWDTDRLLRRAALILSALR